MRRQLMTDEEMIAPLFPQASRCDRHFVLWHHFNADKVINFSSTVIKLNEKNWLAIIQVLVDVLLYFFTRFYDIFDIYTPIDQKL